MLIYFYNILNRFNNRVEVFTSDIDMTGINALLDCTDENNIELHELASVNEIKVDESLLKYVYLYPIISYNILEYIYSHIGVYII